MREKFKYPKEWKLLSVASLADNSKDLFDDGDWIEAEYLTDSGIRLIQTGNVGEGIFVDKEKRKYISEESYTKLKCKELIVGDILICRLADPAGRACILPYIGEEKMITSVDVSIYRPKLDFADRSFLVASMNTPIWFNEIRERCGGSTRTRIARSELGKMKIPLPPLPEQKAIAQMLSTADAAIHTTEKLIAQKELRKKWLMQQLLTGKKRLKGFGGEWKEHSYEKILKVVKRNFAWDENELYKLISVRRRSGGIFYREALYGHQILVKTLRTANEGDFLFSKMQILHGASALVTKEFDGAKISGSYIAVVPKEKKQLNMEFFQWYSQTLYFYHQTYISSYGVHIEKMTFDFDTFLQLEMKLPSIEEQTAIATVLQAADKEISLLKAKAERLREQKKGLMQQLLTGKVRLKVN
jgi:type I restriction enzyme S subunit